MVAAEVSPAKNLLAKSEFQLSATSKVAAEQGHEIVDWLPRCDDKMEASSALCYFDRACELCHLGLSGFAIYLM